MGGSEATRAQAAKMDSGTTMILAKLDESMAKMEEKMNNKFADQITTMNNSFDVKIGVLRENLRSDLKDEMMPKILQNESKINVNAVKICELESKILSLEDSLEHQDKSTDLIIKGIPLLPNEKCFDIYKRISIAIGYGADDIPRADIFRLGKKKPGARFDPPIIVKFTNKLDKFAYFGKYFAKKDLKLTDIGFQVGSRIFINENLTKLNQQLYGEAMRLRKNGKLYSVSTTNGHVSVKQQQGASSIPIKELFDLGKFA
jgi:hypothetical protein